MTTSSVLRGSMKLNLNIAFVEVFDGLEEVHGEAGGDGTVNHSVVVRQAEGQHHAGFDGVVPDHRFKRALAQAENGDFGFVDDGREMRATNAALIRDGER